MTDDEWRADLASRLEAAQLRVIADEYTTRLTQPDTPNIFAGLPANYREWDGVQDFCAAQLKIVDRAKNLVPFTFNWIQRQVVAAEMEKRRQGKPPWFLILKYRKAGVSTLEQALSYWQCWRKPYQHCQTMAHRAPDALTMFTWAMTFYDNQPPANRHSKSRSERREIRFEAPWNSLYEAETAGAIGAGRGKTLSRFHASEAAHYPDLAQMHTAMADSLGEGAAYIIESTPNGQQGRGETFYRMCQEAAAGRSKFTLLFYAWHMDPVNVMPVHVSREEFWRHLDGDARDMMERFKLTPEQVAWWLDKRSGLVADGRSWKMMLQEEPNDMESCFLVGGEPYYDELMLDARAAACEPEPIDTDWGGALTIYEVPDRDSSASYAAGCDVAEGTGGDESTVVGFNTVTGNQAFTWRHNRTAPLKFGADVLPKLGYRWANAATGEPCYFVIERINHGHAALGGLLSPEMGNYPQDRVYHHKDPTAPPNAPDAKRAGWPHSTVEHAQLIALVGRIVSDDAPHVRDPAVIQSIRDVRSDGSGGAEFTGRDLAVAAGLGALGVLVAPSASGYLFINGQVINMNAPKSP